MPKRASRNQPMRWSRVSCDLRHQARSSLCWAGGSLLAAAAGDSSSVSPVEEVVAQESAPPSRQTKNRGNVGEFGFLLMEGPAVWTRMGPKGSRGLRMAPYGLQKRLPSSPLPVQVYPAGQVESPAHWITQRPLPSTLVQ